MSFRGVEIFLKARGACLGKHLTIIIPIVNYITGIIVSCIKFYAFLKFDIRCFFIQETESDGYKLLR